MNKPSILFFITLLFSTAAVSEVLEISVSKQAPELQTMDRPMNGMIKESVEHRFGAPQQMSAPVGDPPISKWTYPDFTVYFEYDAVIHTVLHHQQSTAE